MSAKRFASRTEEEIENLIRNKDSSSTKKATKQAVKILREFCSEKEIPTNFENLTKKNSTSFFEIFMQMQEKLMAHFKQKTR